MLPEHPASHITVRRIVVGNGRMVCTVQLSCECPLNSCKDLMRELLALHPHLPHHVCKNKQGCTFAAVMNNTSIIHVFEHVIIDCMVQESQAKRATSNTSNTHVTQAPPRANAISTLPDEATLFVGNSQWVSKERKTATVEVSFTDDVMALRAIKTAVAHLNAALASCNNFSLTNKHKGVL